jgi:enoyl-CoA hydratase
MCAMLPTVPALPGQQKGDVPMKQLRFVECHNDGTTATVWLNRPPVNAVNSEMYLELQELFANLTDYLPEARAVVLAARGRHFCAGNDLAEFQTMTPDNAPARMEQVRAAFWAIYDAPIPVIAAVHGAAVGAGLGIAASCDLIVAADNAKFGLPEISVGVMGGAKHLSRLVPQGMVRLMYLTGDLIDAQQLHPFGGIVEVVAGNELLATAMDLARSIARHSPVASQFAKQTLNAIEYMELKAGYEYEQGRTAELSGYADSKEAVNAYLEGRAPVYAGR